MGITRTEMNGHTSGNKKRNSVIMKVFMEFSIARFLGLKGIDKGF
jgi:hypothetical protein